MFLHRLSICRNAPKSLTAHFPSDSPFPAFSPLLIERSQFPIEAVPLRQPFTSSPPLFLPSFRSKNLPIDSFIAFPVSPLSSPVHTNCCLPCLCKFSSFFPASPFFTNHVVCERVLGQDRTCNSALLHPLPPPFSLIDAECWFAVPRNKFRFFSALM